MTRSVHGAAAALLVACLAGCVAAPPSVSGSPAGAGDRYSCDGGVVLSARLSEEAALVQGLPSGEARLLRDAGGLTPQQRVYSGAQWRAEFGLGTDGREALLQPLAAAPVLRCRRG